MMAVGPAFSAFRYELVLIPLIAFGYGHIADRALRYVAESRRGDDLSQGAVPR